MGAGCIYCESEADKAYKAAFPDGPKPIATFNNTSEGLAKAREAIGSDALKKAFGPDGGGVNEIIQNIIKAGGSDETV